MPINCVTIWSPVVSCASSDDAYIVLIAASQIKEIPDNGAMAQFVFNTSQLFTDVPYNIWPWLFLVVTPVLIFSATPQHSQARRLWRKYYRTKMLSLRKGIGDDWITNMIVTLSYYMTLLLAVIVVLLMIGLLS